MNTDTSDATTSEPLLSSHHTQQDDIEDPLNDSQFSKSRKSSGFAGLLQSKYVVACALFSSIGGLIFGYDQGIVSAILIMPHFRSLFPLTPLMKGMLTSSLELGAFFGSLTCSPLADKYSRKRTILFGCVIFLVGGFLQAIAGKLWVLFVGRAVGGWGVGMLSCLAPLYMSEISPKELRGSLLALEQFSIVTGVVVGFWYNLLRLY
jgi:MFS family permease